MFTYYLDRGLSCVDFLAGTFKDRTWWLPDLICPEVIDTLKGKVKAVEFYHIEENLDWSPKIIGSNAKIFYTIDYFGAETKLKGDPPPNTIVIRDSVWFPSPHSPVEYYQIWFNSYRKIFHADKMKLGANILSPYRLSGLREMQNLFNHPSMTWGEMSKRWENYYFCKELFEKYAVPGHNQEFPSVFPIVLKNRDEILSKLDTPLPGMWKDLHNLGNVLYNKLAFIPLDSRFNRQRLSDLASRINELANDQLHP